MKALCKQRGIKGCSGMKRAELVQMFQSEFNM
jgi:hypothetical protein